MRAPLTDQQFDNPQIQVPTTGAPLKVMIVDTHPIMLIGLRSVLQSDPDIELVGTWDTGRQALEACRRTSPSLVVMDLILPDMTGIELCRAIKQSAPNVNVLILTACDDDASIFGAVSAGASGYVLTDITPENVLRAIHAIRQGQTMVNPGITRRVFDRLSVITRNGKGGLLFSSKLTQREIETLAEVAKGLTNKEIAQQLFISENTVKSRLRTIFGKIDARDRVEAAAFAIRSGYAR